MLVRGGSAKRHGHAPLLENLPPPPPSFFVSRYVLDFGNVGACSVSVCGVWCEVTSAM